MVTPLDIKVVECAQDVHNLVGAGTTVKHVAQDVQLVDGELLDEVTNGDNEVVGTASADDGVHNNVDIGLLVAVGGVLVQQLLDDVGKTAGQRLVDLRAGILRRHVAAHAHQPVDGDEIPVFEVGAVVHACLHQLEFALGIVDERAQLLLVAAAERVVENLTHLALDGTRGVAQHMLESLVLTVQVGKEVLGAFRQVQNCREVDNLGARCCHIGKIVRQQFQKS